MILNPEKISQHFNTTQSATICSKIASLGYDQEKTAAIQASTKIDGSNFELRYYCFPGLGDGNRTDVITALFQKKLQQLQGKMLNYMPFYPHFKNEAKSGCQIFIHKSACRLIEHQGVQAIYRYCQTLYDKSFLQFAVDVIIRSPAPADMLRLSVARWRQFDEPMAEAISKQASLSLSMSLPSETA